MASRVPILDEIRGKISSEQFDWDARDKDYKPVFQSMEMRVRLPANNIVRELSPEKLVMAAVEVEHYLKNFITPQLAPVEKQIRLTIASSVRTIAARKSANIVPH